LRRNDTIMTAMWPSQSGQSRLINRQLPWLFLAALARHDRKSVPG
jgi:hypothetical protein